MVNVNDIKSILKDVEAINRRYEAVKKEREDSGVMYNIFGVLGMTYDEVKHSAFIASLLRSERHGAGTKFLEAFLRMLNLPGFLDPQKTIVETERDIGPRTDTEGGRIDLFLEDDTNCIIIENKIYAGDQEAQLLRYHNYRPNAKLMYLTLDGTKPSDYSLKGLDRDAVTCISYKYDILSWLKECVQIAANLPYIRETINQYIKTIQQLTDTIMNTNPEIIKLLSAPDKLSAAFAIKDNLDATMNSIMNEFVQKLESKLKESELPFRCKYQETDWVNTKYARLSFNAGWKHVTLGIEFAKYGLSDSSIGIYINNLDEDICQNEAAKEFATRAGFTRKSPSWLWCWCSESKYYIPQNWNTADVMKMLIDGTMIDRIIKMLERMQECSKGLVGL